jgi:MFS family permease
MTAPSVMTPSVVPRLRHARWAGCLYFLLAGTAIGTWTARIPAVKQALGLGDGELSIALVGFVAGAITGMQLVGRLIDRHGSLRVVTVVAMTEAIVVVLPGFAPNLAVLTATLFCFGVNHGALNIAMNAHAVEVERGFGRPILSSLHAMYSIGGFVGAVVGGVFAYAELSAAGTFLAMAALVVVLAWQAARWAAAGPGRRAGDDQPTSTGGRVPLPGIAFLGALAFCGLVGEGTAADWSTVHLTESLGSSPAIAAIAYAAFCVMMTAGRLSGDRIASRHGPVALVRGCALIAAVGLGGALLIGQPWAGVVGFGLFGAGLSCIAPQVFSAAGHRHPAHAGRAIARAASLGYLGFFTGPIMIGITAELTDLSTALWIPTVLTLFIALAATALRPSPARAELRS